MCPCHNIIEFLNSVSWKCDFFVTYQRRFTANVPTLLNRNLHPDCNNWTNIYPQCVKRNSCSLRWHLQKSSPVQIGQRKVREKAVKVKVTLKYFFPDTFQLKSKQTPPFLVTNFWLPHKGLRNHWKEYLRFIFIFGMYFQKQLSKVSLFSDISLYDNSLKVVFLVSSIGAEK